MINLTLNDQFLKMILYKYFLTFLIFYTTFFLLKFLISIIKTFQKALKIPTARLTFRKLAKYKLDPKQVFNAIYKNLKYEENGLVKGWNGPMLFILIKSPSYARIVLQKCLRRSRPHDFVDLKRSILFGSGFEWEIQRKILSPHFKKSSIIKHHPMFEDESEKFIKYIHKFVGEGEVDLLNAFSTLGYKISVHGMGLKDDNEYGQFDEFLKSLGRFVLLQTLNIPKNITHCKIILIYHRILHCATLRMSIFWLYPQQLYKFSKLYKKESFERSKWNKASENIIKGIKTSNGFIKSLIDGNLDEEIVKETTLSILLGVSL